MDKATKLALTITFGVAGIVGKVIVWGGPVWDVALLSELSAWAGGIAVGVIVFFTAETAKEDAKESKESAKRGEVEARSARRESSEARQESSNARREQAESMSRVQKRRVAKAKQKAA